MSVCRRRAKNARLFRQLSQTANSLIVQFTSTLLFDLFSAGSTEDCIIFLSNILEKKLFFKYFSVVFCRVCFVNICNKGSLTVSRKREKIHSIKNDTIKQPLAYNRVSILQSSLVSSVESRLHNRDSFLTIETRFSHSRLDSHNRDSFLTIETRFSHSRLDSHNRDSILTFETRFSQSRLDSHNRDSILTIETRFLQSRLDSHNRVSFLAIESRPYNRVSFL